MRHGLPGCRTEVHPDVEAFWPVAPFDLRARDADRSGEGVLLLLGGVEPGFDVPAGDEEGVTGTDREAVPKTNGQRRLEENAL
jgi:hypothetical protein